MAVRNIALAPVIMWLFFTQVALSGHCLIPEPKPDSEKLLDFFHSVKILKAEAVHSEEYIHGHKVKGKKVIVAGTLQLGIEYSANSPEQMVHYFHCDIPFNAIILRCVNQQELLLPCDFCLDDYLVHVCIEHIEVKRISERVFERVIVLMIWLQHRGI